MSLPKTAGFAIGFKCSVCGASYPLDGPVQYTCPNHKEDECCNLDVVYDYEAMKQAIVTRGLAPEAGMWRYRPFLPISARASVPNLLVGGTPFYACPSVAQVRMFYLKDEGRNPTASLKDRASSLIAAKVKAEGRGVISAASTGISASMGMPCVIFVPKAAPVAKITQLRIYGAKIVLVDGVYDDAFDLCAASSAKYGFYNRNTGSNPYTAEGKKTCALELCEQYAAMMDGVDGSIPTPPMVAPAFAAPDWIVVSVGDGNIISGIYSGLKDLVATGFLHKMPRLLAVQAEGSASVYEAWKSGSDSCPTINSTTIADSIAADIPRDGRRAVRAIRETKGVCITVSDPEILAAIPDLARATGVFPEPAASCAYAGFVKARHMKDSPIHQNDSVAMISTGNGLKDVLSAQKSLADTAAPPVVKPKDLGGLEQALKEAYNIKPQ